MIIVRHAVACMRPVSVLNVYRAADDVLTGALHSEPDDLEDESEGEGLRHVLVSPKGLATLEVLIPRTMEGSVPGRLRTEPPSLEILTFAFPGRCQTISISVGAGPPRRRCTAQIEGRGPEGRADVNPARDQAAAR